MALLTLEEWLENNMGTCQEYLIYRRKEIKILEEQEQKFGKNARVLGINITHELEANRLMLKKTLIDLENPEIVKKC